MRARASFVAGLALGGVIVAAVSGSSDPQLVVAQTSSNQRNPVEGVWRAVEQTINERRIDGPKLGTGYHVYTRGGHFAAVRESGDGPRVQVDVETATARQLLDMWGPFVAQFGTFSISGDVIRHNSLVAKNPGNQRDAETDGMRFKVDGKTLTLETNRPPGQGRHIILRMVRVE